ncbi:MAG: aminotransferase class V-fold PLP-dependent enzyme, partial [Verrucomicrobiota bacterium]
MSSVIYLDHNATTPVDAAVRDELMPCLNEQFGNPSSPYQSGRLSRESIERAREKLADLLSCEPRELIWTSGGTEANTLAILSAVEVTGKNHIVTSTVEHHAVSEVIDYLQKKGCAV